MRSAWKGLQLPHSDPATPPLVLKYEFGTSNYTVWISDLTFIWSETLDRKRIIQRSFNVDTSIDPSEGSDQLRLFLQSVENALEQRVGTTLDLVQSDGDRRLLLRTCTPLPGSLKPFEWFIELVPASQSTLTSELVRPMLSQQVTANLEKRSLIQHLKEKDQIIAKLTDKVQSDGVDLGRLFPGVVSSKSGKPSSRKALGKLVKGLDEFDEQKWRDRLLNNEASSIEYAHLISDAFENYSVGLSETIQFLDPSNWWEKLRHRDSQREGDTRYDEKFENDENLTQGDFQRQSTPTKLRRHSPKRGKGLNFESKNNQSKKPKQQHDDRDSTTDDSDHRFQSSLPKSPLQRKDSAIAGKVLRSAQKSSQMPIETKSRNDGIGAARELQNEQVSPKVAKDTRGQSSASSSDEGSIGLEENLSLRSKPEVADEMLSEIPVPNPKPKLGKIGGKGRGGKESNPESLSGHNVAINPSKSTSGVNSDPKRRIESSLTSKVIESERGGRSGVPANVPSPPRETSQERANRKRQQLKRELESKGQAGTKKKRKF